jgi:hypothetical protein
MAFSLRGVLSEVATESCDDEGALELKPVAYVTLVLPQDRALPMGEEEALTCESMTKILATIGGRASWARVAVQEGSHERSITPWQLPCVME